MKSIKNILGGLAIIGGFIALSGFIHAQVTTAFAQGGTASLTATNIDWRTASDLQVMLAAIETTTPLPATDAPSGGNFHTIQHLGDWPPLPGDVYGLPFWDLGDGFCLLDDRDFDYAAFAQQNAALHTLAKEMGLEMDDENTGSSYTFDTNGLWLEITNVANGLACLNLHNATDMVYEVWSKTDLLATNWDIEQEVWPTNPAVMPFVVPELGRTNLFIWARDWTGITSGGNETPEWWFWKYFGAVDLSDTNLDSTGTYTLLDDYQNDLDPNVIQFSLQFTNQYVNTTTPNATVIISQGVPSYVAVLINDMNQTDAVWQPYTTSNVVVTLGSTNGTYGVSVGLRGLPPDATQTWRWSTVTLYSDVPMLTITSPTTSIVSQSPIQLQGYASNPLESLSFDVSNAAGIFTNQTGFLTGQFYDTNLLAYTTNYFECSGIVLSNGTNVITLHATDWAENTANVSFALDYSPNTNPPVLNLVWPQDGTTISGSNFTLQAQVSDPTATVTASVNGNAVQGLVEQNGSVWAQNLPLNAGTNAVSLMASNAFGGVSVTNFNVIGNDVGLVINPLTSDQLNQSLVTVTGSINDPSDTVTVNGIQASVDSETGNWVAYNVPVNPTGTASLNAQVGDSNNNPLSSGAANQPQPAMVVLAGYSGFINDSSSVGYGPFNLPYLSVYTANWAYDSGGNETDTGYTPNDAGIAENNINGSDNLPADGPGFATPELPLVWDYFSVNTSTSYENGTVSFQRSSQAQVMIAPSGQQQAGTTNLYLVLASASEYSNPVQDFGEGPGDLPLPPEWLQINGQTLINTGITNEDGSVSGATLVTALAGTTPFITPTNTQFYYNKAASYNVQVTNVQLRIVANGTTLNSITTNAEFCVGQQVTFSNYFDPPVTNIVAGKFIKWTFQGNYVNNYTGGSSGSSTNYFVDSDKLTNDTTSAWWVSGGANPPATYTVTLAESLTLNNGQQVVVIAKGLFNMFRPSVAIVDKNIHGTPVIDWGETWNLQVLGYHGEIEMGLFPVANYMDYTVRVTSSDFGGTAKFTQLCSRNDSFSVTTNVVNWLDNQDPYNPTWQVYKNPNPTGNTCLQELSDAPSATGYGRVFMYDTFTDYVMFTPGGSGDIYVPLGKIIWSDSGDATNPSLDITPNSVTGPSNPDGSYDWPVWTQIYVNGVFFH